MIKVSSKVQRERKKQYPATYEKGRRAQVNSTIVNKRDHEGELERLKQIQEAMTSSF
jgi:hypothetical protein